MEYKRIFAEHVLNTPSQAPILLCDALVGQLSPEIYDFLAQRYSISSPDVYISSWSLKHAYDERPEFIVDYLDSMPEVFERPDGIVLAKPGHRGNFTFFKKFREKKFLACPAEVCVKDFGTVLSGVTFFPAKAAYIKKSAILWSREDDVIPPS